MTGTLFGFCPDAQAHSIEAALTTIELNERTQTVEVIHRLFTHDLKPAIEAALNTNYRPEDAEQADKLLEHYVSQSFTLESAGGTSIPLTWIGHETDGDMTLIYQEIESFGNINSLRIRNSLLHDTAKAQINTVNLSLGNTEETLIFGNGLLEQQIELE